MYRHRIRPPGGNRLALTGHAGVGGGIGTLFTKPLTGISALAARGRMAISQSGFGYVTTAPPPTEWNITPAPLFLQGANQSYNVAATGPVNLGYAPGGTYDVASGTLPSSMTMSPEGMLQDSGAPSSSPNVAFGYNEPGALPTFTLHSGAPSGTLPWMGTVYPTEGAVPAGMSLSSPQDTSMRSSVLSTWPDGSAQVIVVAGHKTGILANSTTTVQVRPAIVSDTPLTTSNLIAIVGTVGVNFGSPLLLTLTTSNHDRIWWANSQVICARYRLQITNKGAMEAVIDVHAFVNGRAFVEVVIENGRIDAGVSSPSAPAPQNYTSATVSVNGVSIVGSGVSSPTVNMEAPNSRPINSTVSRYVGDHEPFRAWYCSGWVGGDPGIEVTHDAASLQAHPWFWKNAVPSSENMATIYQRSYDIYVPWSTGRLRVPGMNGTGGDEEISMHTTCQAAYFGTGDKYARRAVLTTGLALLSTNINYRHQDGSVPTKAQQRNKMQVLGTWPFIYTEPWYGGGTGDASHIPSIALIPFLCRPSPCFIELSQKELIWHQAGYRNQTDIDAGDTGSHSYDQTRSRGWRVRNNAITIFLTPDSGTWNTGAANDSTRKADYRSVLRSEIDRDRSFMNLGWNTFKYLHDPTINDPSDASGSRALSQGHWFMHHYVTMAYLHVASAKVLRGADQTAVETAARELCEYPLRWFSDSISYEWRVVPYQPTVGVRSGSTIDESPGNLVGLTRSEMSGTLPNAPGSWMTFGPGQYVWPTTGESSAASVNYGEGTYPSWFFHMVCGAVEMGVPGAEAAWTKIYGTNGFNGGIDNLMTWRNGMSTTPAWNRWPRNK